MLSVSLRASKTTFTIRQPPLYVQMTCNKTTFSIRARVQRQPANGDYGHSSVGRVNSRKNAREPPCLRHSREGQNRCPLLRNPRAVENPSRQHVASIGPRSFNRGNVIRKSMPSFLCCALQLGRGLSTAETLADRIEEGQKNQLQLGRSLSTAETVGIGILVAYGFRLQLGRGLSTAETRIPLIPIAVTNQLQLGRGLSTAETDEAGLNFPARSWLQLGRGLSTAETLRLCCRWHENHHASIGPRSFNRGNGP